MRRIPHPWWHFFFIKDLGIYSSGDELFQRVSCSKCKKIYKIFDDAPAEYIEVNTRD